MARKRMITPDDIGNLFYYGPPEEAFQESAKKQKSPYNHEHLPVYRALRELKEFFDKDEALDSVPRQHRYALVDKCRDDIIEIEVQIYMTYDTTDLGEKVDALKEAIKYTLRVRGKIRSLMVRKYITEDKTALYGEFIHELAKQLIGWKDSTQKRMVKQ